MGATARKKQKLAVFVTSVYFSKYRNKIVLTLETHCTSTIMYINKWE